MGATLKTHAVLNLDKHRANDASVRVPQLYFRVFGDDHAGDANHERPTNAAG